MSSYPEGQKLENMLSWRHSGFHVYIGDRITPSDNPRSHAKQVLATWPGTLFGLAFHRREWSMFRLKTQQMVRMTPFLPGFLGRHLILHNSRNGVIEASLAIQNCRQLTIHDLHGREKPQYLMIAIYATYRIGS